jgi:hypothetical protein
VRLLFVVPFLKVFQELSLEFVNIFNVSKNSGELRNSEHCRVLATLSNVALQNTKTNLCIYTEVIYLNNTGIFFFGFFDWLVFGFELNFNYRELFLPLWVPDETITLP